MRLFDLVLSVAASALSLSKLTSRCTAALGAASLVPTVGSNIGPTALGVQPQQRLVQCVMRNILARDHPDDIVPVVDHLSDKKNLAECGPLLRCVALVPVLS